MNAELLEALDRSIALANRLLFLINADMADMRECVRGEILTQYQKSTAIAQEEAERLKEQIVALRVEKETSP